MNVNGSDSLRYAKTQENGDVSISAIVAPRRRGAENRLFTATRGTKVTTQGIPVLSMDHCGPKSSQSAQILRERAGPEFHFVPNVLHVAVSRTSRFPVFGAICCRSPRRRPGGRRCSTGRAHRSAPADWVGSCATVWFPAVADTFRLFPVRRAPEDPGEGGEEEVRKKNRTRFCPRKGGESEGGWG